MSVSVNHNQRDTTMEMALDNKTNSFSMYPDTSFFYAAASEAETADTHILK